MIGRGGEWGKTSAWQTVLKQDTHTYSALHKYWNSKDKIALLAVESRHLQI